MAMGWHSGIRAGVCFAAMMPATRATPRTSPFFIWFARIRAAVEGSEKCTRQMAVAVRSVSALLAMEIMCAVPLGETWVRAGLGASELELGLGRLVWTGESDGEYRVVEKWCARARVGGCRMGKGILCSGWFCTGGKRWLAPARIPRRCNLGGCSSVPSVSSSCYFKGHHPNTHVSGSFIGNILA